MKPFIVGIGGTTRPGSTSETALRRTLEAAELAGAETALVAGRELELPAYDPSDPHRAPAAQRLVELMRAADGFIISSPAYHGGPSGIIKNALDYAEDMAGDHRPYFEGRAVGLIVAAHGVQAMGTTLSALRAVVHALRGWPTPLAVTLNGRDAPFEAGGRPREEVAGQLDTLARQVVDFACWQQPVEAAPRLARRA